MAVETKIIAGTRLLDVLRTQDWDTILKKAHAHAKTRLFFKYKVKSVDMQNKWADVFVDLALEQVYEETRKWNEARYPTFLEFFLGAINSIIWNNIKSVYSDTPLRGKNEEPMPEEDFDSGYDLGGAISDADLEQRIRSELEQLGADDDVMLVFQAIVEGNIKRREIAKDLGLEMDVASPILRRWARVRDKALANLDLVSHEDQQ